MSLTKFHLFYIQYLQLQREIKLSIGYKTFLWQFHTTHISDFNSFWVHVNMHMIWKTHTCVFLMCIKRQKHTHTILPYGMLCWWICMYSGCWCWNTKNSFDLLYCWQTGQISHAHTQTPLKVKKEKKKNRYLICQKKRHKYRSFIRGEDQLYTFFN